MKTRHKIYIGIGIVLLLGMIFLALPSEEEEIEENGILETLHEGVGTMVKLNKCTELCAGKDINIPAIKQDCYSSCYNLYYYFGEEELNKYIEDME